MFKRSGVNIHQEKTCFAFFIFWLDLIVSLPPNFSTEALDPLEASPPDFRYLPTSGENQFLDVLSLRPKLPCVDCVKETMAKLRERAKV